MSAIAMQDACSDLSLDVKKKIASLPIKADQWVLDVDVADLQRGLDAIRDLMVSGKAHSAEAYIHIEAEIAHLVAWAK